MDISGATAAASIPATTPRASINSDFDTFLKMMTAQLRNQDPLDPMDASDFAVQLATFSGVEQQVRTNDLLSDMVAKLGISGLSDMASWIGKEVRVAAPVRFDGSPVTISPNPARVADRAELIVRDEAGAEIQRIVIPVRSEPVQWAGVTTDGAPLPPGLYGFEVASYQNDALILQEPAEAYALVKEVRAEAGTARLVLDGGTEVNADTVTAIRSPG
jgi:flagellar basal-body rod modification protein FlgD